jgi:hypothetical protein
MELNQFFQKLNVYNHVKSAQMSTLEEQFYEITSCELPHDADPNISLDQHLNTWFLQQISSIEEDIMMIKKQIINVTGDIALMLNYKLEVLKSELDSLKRRKFAAKGILKKD